MDLIHNQTFRLKVDMPRHGYCAGIYRVVFDEPRLGTTVVVLINADNPTPVYKGGRKKLATTKNPRKKPKNPLVGKLIWIDRSLLVKKARLGQLELVTVHRSKIYGGSTDEEDENFTHRRKTMANFLDAEHLHEQILMHRGLGGLVKESMTATSVSRGFVYTLWSTLCRLGFEKRSLLLRHDLCGAPGVLRPCDPPTDKSPSRQKAGRKETAQRVAKQFGKTLAPQQPGISTGWRLKILAADKLINTKIKPQMPSRCLAIVQSGFITTYTTDGGKLTPVMPPLGTYPNARQIEQVLKTGIPWIERLLEKTTKGHFKRNLRGLIAKSWKGVAGPGHTYAIDSTLADCYLRSSINRAWIIGRPIVYVLVDIWSTAVVGFHVCLTGPSWATAQVSLFNTVAPIDLMSELVGYSWSLGLNPHPTFPYCLLCDRGEYLSQAAAKFGLKAIQKLSYAPPFRPDLKGLVEVLHRIAKDQIFFFIPGAHDFHRAEMELRKSRPNESALNLHEFVAWLHSFFLQYNLTADRRNRLDAHMVGAGVYPSPAGLWRYGHEMHIGMRRYLPEETLINELLPQEEGFMTSNSFNFLGNSYTSDVIVKEGWSTYARNLGGWSSPTWYHPWKVGRAWIPHQEKGLINLTISDQANASAELPFDDVDDAKAHQLLQNPKQKHEALFRAISAQVNRQSIVATAQKAAEEADAKSSNGVPSITEARKAEVSQKVSEPVVAPPAISKSNEEGLAEHIAMLQILHSSKVEASERWGATQ